MLLFAVIGACHMPAPSADGDDTAAEAPSLFTEATLSPTFAHNRSVWAGVALLDFDGDGWTDLFFTNGKGEQDGLYRNLGDGTFEDVAEEAGISEIMESGQVVAGDVDNDGDPDLVVSASCSTGSYTSTGNAMEDGEKVLYRNKGGVFTAEPLADVLAFDDGRTTLVSELCSVSLALADVDLDGNLDLFFANSVDPDIVAPWVFNKGDSNSTDWVSFNDGTGHFTTFQALPTHIGTTFALATTDFDGDGLPETIAGRSGWPMEELEWTGEQVVPTEAPMVTLDAGLWMGIAPADYDRDGDLDLYVTNQGLSTLMHGYDNTAHSEFPAGVAPYLFQEILLNDGSGTFARTDWPVRADQVLAGDLYDGFSGSSEYVGPENLERYAWGWGAVAVDWDADGWVEAAYNGNNCAAPMDIIWSEDKGAGPGALFHNLEGAGFEDVTWDAGIANVDDEGRYPDGRGIAVGDLNNDGYADLVYVNKSYDPSQSDPLAQELGYPHVWLSKPRDNNWLEVHLVGTESARDANGSLVRVTDSRGTTVHAYAAGGGTNGSSENLLILGLGEDTTVDLQVVFPSGNVVELDDVAANQRLEVTE